MHGNVQYKIEHIFVWFYDGYGINVTGVNGREIIILFSMCRHAHSCTFISVIELPRIPAYCPKYKPLLWSELWMMPVNTIRILSSIQESLNTSKRNFSLHSFYKILQFS